MNPMLRLHNRFQGKLPKAVEILHTVPESPGSGYVRHKGLVQYSSIDELIVIRNRDVRLEDYAFPPYRNTSCLYPDLQTVR